jgi:EAL domain-containing protein (putative c-di-GMP-specific phosphodiesterase class I)
MGLQDFYRRAHTAIRAVSQDSTLIAASLSSLAYFHTSLVTPQQSSRRSIDVLFAAVQGGDLLVNRVKRFPEFQIFLQPIVDLKSASVFAYEALCRGVSGEHYPELVAQVDPKLTSRFDERIMIKELQLAAALRLESMGAKISLNMGPDAGLDRAHVLQEAKRLGIKPSSIVIELTEGVRMDPVKLARIIAQLRSAGVVVAFDDFGGGYAGLNVLATCVPDVLKIDAELIRNIHSSPLKKTIVGAFADVCRTLNVEIIAEGVETIAEVDALHHMGINLMQGYFFAHPHTGKIPEVSFPRKYQKTALANEGPRISKSDRERLRRAIRQ